MTKSEFKELVEKGLTDSLDSFEEDLEEWCRHNNEPVPNKVARELKKERHRWYEIFTDVYKCSDGYMGVRGVGLVYHEGGMGPSDVAVYCIAHEYEPYTVTSYRPVKE